MTTRIGINGFGRIGRQVVKVIRAEYPDELDIVAFNDLGDLPTMAHLFKYDSTYGKYPGAVEISDGGLRVDGDHIRALSVRDPAELPWGELGVQIVIESTGLFTSREPASKHLAAGARKVIISAPSKDPDVTIVLGVNEGMYKPADHHIVSNASCTTNCLAPAAKVVQDEFGIEKALMTTIHAYTNDQNLLDLPHKDLRRARAAGLSMIPTTTGAASAVGEVLPDLKGKLDGFAMRVPTPNVSVVDLAAIVDKKTTGDEVNAALKAAAGGALKGILQYSTDELVSIDFKGNPHSSIVDAPYTKVMDGDFVKVLSWYDNEWGYSSRCVDLLRLLVKRGI
jgi:glyceraldehyde 3-phosphate dehydrogenase